MSLLSKEEQEYYIELGKQDFMAGVRCQPYQSKRLSEEWAKSPCKIGSDESKKRTEAAQYWMKGWTMANLSPQRNPDGMKFVGFEDIYENCNAGTDYWVICNNLPQKYIDEAKSIDGDNYLESCFGIVITYGYEGYPDEEKEREWFIDCNAPFYVDNDGNWNYLDYTLSDEEKEEVIKLCKDEMDREQELESLKEELTNIINECESEELTEERRTQLDERYLEVQNRISELLEKDPALGIKPTAKKGKSR